MFHLSRPCLLRVGVIGINHKTADLGLREAIARGTESFADERGLFFHHPTVLLSTCNRTEIYFSSDDLAAAHSDLLSLLRGQIEVPFAERLYSYFGIDCFAHLCRVTAGLDSAIIAETEIQRQVKVAYQRSCDVAELPGCLHYIFQKGLKVGKEVRNQLELERGSPNLYGTLWQIGEEALGSLKQKRILLVGNSKINRGFLSFLIAKGARNLTLSTKNPVPMKEAFVTDRSILQEWPSFDLIVCASKSDGYLITGKGKSLIFDLSVPRNVDPEVGCSAALWNIEQVNHKIEQRRKAQADGLQRCYSLIWQQVIHLARLYRLKNEGRIFVEQLQH